MAAGRSGTLVNGVVAERSVGDGYLVLTEAWDMVPCSLDDALRVPPEVGDRVAVHLTRGAFRCGVILVVTPPNSTPAAAVSRRGQRA